jgi:hypothetical protein
MSWILWLHGVPCHPGFRTTSRMGTLAFESPFVAPWWSRNDLPMAWILWLHGVPCHPGFRTTSRMGTLRVPFRRSLVEQE